VHERDARASRRDKMGYSIEGKTMAMSYIIHQYIYIYIYGITILKQQSNGEFKAIEVQKSKNADGSDSYSLTPCY
jgi:hypothetical protein